MSHQTRVVFSYIMTLQLNYSEKSRGMPGSPVLFLCMVFSLGLLKFCLSHTCSPDHVECPLWGKPTTALFKEGPILRQPCSGITSTKQSCMCWIPFVVWMWTWILKCLSLGLEVPSSWLFSQEDNYLLIFLIPCLCMEIKLVVIDS